MQRRDLLATLAGFGVAAGVLAVLATLVGAGDVLDALGRAHVGLAALVAGAILAWIVLWGASLRAVLAAGGSHVSPTDAVLVNAGAAFANHVTPFGQAGGEPVAAWLLSDVSDASFERSLAAITSFDVLNVVPSLTLAVVGLGYYSAVTVLGARLRSLALAVAVAAVALPVAGVLAWVYRDRLEAVAVRVITPAVRVGGRVLPRAAPPARAVVADRVGRFVAGIESVAGDRRRLATALLLSTAGWVVQAVGLWVALRAVGATGVPVYVPLFVVPLGTVASAMPTPGGLGGIETVQVALLAATTTVAGATLTAAVLLFSVGGFFLTTAVGAGAVVVIRIRHGDDGADRPQR